MSISPRIGVECTGLSGYTKEQKLYKRSDVKVSNLDIEIVLGGTITYHLKKNAISLIFDRKNLGESIQIINDSSVEAGFNSLIVRSNHARIQTSRTHLYMACIIERYHDKFPKSKKIKLSYGLGLGVGFNRSEWYYKNTQGAGRTSAYIGGDNYYWIERNSKPNGCGVFSHVSGGLSFFSKKDKEKAYLKFFWSKGWRAMVFHSINYKYGYSPAGAGSGQSVTNYQFISRGTTFGVVCGFPIYL